MIKKNMKDRIGIEFTDMLTLSHAVIPMLYINKDNNDHHEEVK